MSDVKSQMYHVFDLVDAIDFAIILISSSFSVNKNTKSSSSDLTSLALLISFS